MRHTSILTLCFLLGSCQEINPAANRQLPSAPAIDQTESPAEANILMAYAQLDDFIDICLGSIQCGLAKQEEDVLNLIRQSLQQEFSKPNQIQFESENARPGFFLQEGEIHIARTGEEVGSHVYFNRDLLYVEASDGSKHPLNMFRAIGLLVQKLGEHHRITDRTFLANLGGKVSQAVLLNTQNIKKAGTNAIYPCKSSISGLKRPIQSYWFMMANEPPMKLITWGTHILVVKEKRSDSGFTTFIGAQELRLTTKAGNKSSRETLPFFAKSTPIASSPKFLELKDALK